MVEWIKSPIGAVVAAAVTIALVAVVAFSGGGDEESTPGSTQTASAPDPVSAAELASLSESLGQPVYWAGPQGTKEYELTRQDERIVVRYPVAGGGSATDGSLTVGTYRLDGAQAAIRRAGRASTAKLHRLPRGGLAVSDSTRATNVYLAYPKEPYQVEVFDPKPGRALSLVLGGRIKPVR